MESNLLDLSRSYPGECRHCEQHIFLDDDEIKVNGVEVGVASQVNGVVL
jgi:hypothetical protein